MTDIELVIKMPEEEYKNICLMSNDGIGMALYDWIANGTPLPKGHGDLIDRKYLIEDFKTSKKISFAERMDISCIVDHAPTIIEADVAESEEEE